MNENIDLTKILKDCPIGTTLYSIDNGYVEFLRVDTKIGIYHIVVKIKYTGTLDYYNKKGKANNFKDAECCLFPSKDQRDWSKFTAPWYKKEMDTIARIEKQGEPNPYNSVSFKYNGHTWGMCARDNGVEILVDGEIKERIFLDNKPKGKSALEAIKEEKVDNELTKTLCSEYTQKLYNPSDTGKNEQKSADKIEPKFKVGDRVRHKETNKDDVYEISKVYDDSYGIAGFTWMIYMKYQDQYELVTNKFDPKTLSPFDKVLVKISNESYNTWYADFVAEPSHTKNETPLILGAKEANMVIPYNEETKHLVGTNEEAPEYYRYWED